jgi:transcriptional regulator with XRE-family HTH domain
MAHKWRDIRKTLSPEAEARIQKRVDEEMKRISLTLAQLRKARKFTQEKLATELNVPQGAVSKAEHRADMYISTLRGYIEAMGGTLEIRALFPDAEIVIDQFEDIDERKNHSGTAPGQHATAGRVA